MKRIFLSALLVICFASCQEKLMVTPIPGIQDSIVVDGVLEEDWDGFRQYNITDVWWGELPKDSSDLSGYFKIFYNRSHLYLLVFVVDDILYTHPIPTEEIDKRLWDDNDYDKIVVNLMQGDQTFSVGLNYKSEAIFGKHSQCPNARYAGGVTREGYFYEISMALQDLGFHNGGLRLNVAIHDNDMAFNRQGIDVFSQRETMIGYSNSFTLDHTSKREP